MSIDFDRRKFLKGSAGAAGLALMSFTAAGGVSAKTLLAKPVPVYVSWQDVYRKQWTWDKVVRSTHIVNCWYQAHCAWDVYVKDGLVFREEQAAEYPRVNNELPDYNPRGCQKGGCFSERMYDPTRVTHPLRRVGPRGGGKWERVSWDEALTDIADTWIDVAVEEGADRVIWDLGPGIDLTQSAAATLRIAGLAQAVCLDMNTEIGDGRRGSFETFGKIGFESSADDYFYSDLILFWAGNPLYTQIPNAHFLTEAKYRGARIISIAPDYNASATKADLWVPIKVGTDAALAMGIAHMLVKDGKLDRDFMREQTDMPLLVREDNAHFLCEADLREGGKRDQFYVLDEASGSIKEVPRKTLALGDLRPALEANAKVRMRDGSEIRVRTVFDRLRDRLAEYTPEKVAVTCGISHVMVLRLAQEIGAAKRMRNIAQSTFSKFYHGNLAERAQILIFALTGQIGRKGAGYSAFPFLAPEGLDQFALARTVKDLEGHLPEIQKAIETRLAAGDTLEMILYDLGALGFRPGALPGLRVPIWASGTLFWHVHGGVKELSDDAPDWNRGLKRTVDVHLTEALEKKWQFVFPAPGQNPRIMFTLASNPFRRIRGNQKLTERFLPKLKKYVVMDWRLNSSGRFADYVLPITPWYENTNFKWVTPLSPYLTIANQATPPMGQSKSDWEAIILLAKKIQQRARERKIGAMITSHGVQIDFSKLYDEITMNGAFSEKDGEKVVKHMYESGKVYGDTTWEEFKEKGIARFTRTTTDTLTISNMCDIPKDDSMVALTNHVVKKVPYPTTTRRIQFYLDHPTFHEYDEVLPRHKNPPTLGGDYPLTLNGGKTRWSIHSSWRDSQTMLRLHHREPYVLISEVDAKKRRIKDDEWVRVHNDTGEFQARAAVTPTMQAGQALIYHAWERHQFRGKGDMNSVSPSPLNPVELAGGEGQHLRSILFQGQGSMFDRETRVEIEPMGAAS